MKLNFYKILAIAITIAFGGCKVNKNQQSAINYNNNVVILDDIVVTAPKVFTDNYQEAAPRIADILHTKLAISFNWQQQLVYGKAVLTVKPYQFKQLSTLTLNANTFLLHRIALLKNKDTIDLNYTYDKRILNINLSKTYNHTDTFKIYIHYTAQPNKINDEVGSAITDSKGLYFINPLGTDPNKPQQIWTQGESKYNSGWFPTIDEPNEKHTQEIAISVDPKFTTLSNGELVYSNYNKDGSRTDYWQQLKPHAPYLTMMAIGEFAVIKDKWRNTMEVNYYVEPKYKPYAKTIFGTTPEMIEVFSKATGVDYPWDKYSQVVVRDFVSGAMENTSAVVHYEAVAHTNREHLDNTHEDIIAHELFHHWFGDLVTCKSWSNLPLNESFATYGEYIWNEHKHGKPTADLIFNKNLDSYLRSKNKYNTVPIRTHFNHQDEMFDVVSYQKGSRILHMLRYVIGSEAFFKGIEIYLTKNKFGNTDIHHLRHAMEEASGKDLTQFFNQWFLQAGHPNLVVNYTYNNNTLTVITKQLQDSIYGLYNLPSSIVVVYNGKNNKKITETQTIILKNNVDTFNITIDGEILFASIDMEGVLLAQLTENKPNSWWLNQLKNSDNYVLKLRSTRKMSSWNKADLKQPLIEAIDYCINDSVTLLNNTGYSLMFVQPDLINQYHAHLFKVIKTHPVAKNRELAIRTISKSNDSLLSDIYINSLTDSSYHVVATCLEYLYNANRDLGLAFIERWEKEENNTIQLTIAEIYSDESVQNKNYYYAKNLGKQGLYRYSFLKHYLDYLKSKKLDEINMGITVLQNYAKTNSDEATPRLLLNGIKSITNQVKEFTDSEEKLQLLNKIKAFETELKGLDQAE